MWGDTVGLFQKIFPKAKSEEQKALDAVNGFFKTFTAYSPVFTSWSGGVYESELVRAAIAAKASHISKLKVECMGAAQPKLQARFRQGPNEFQTWGQFLYRLCTILEVQNTAFIVPIEDDYGEEITGIFPVLPTRCEIVDVNGEAWLRYSFLRGDVAAVELSRCGILTKFQYEDDFFGQSNRALLPTMDLISLQNQGIAEAVKNSAAIRFIAKLNNFSNAEDLAKEQKRFSSESLKRENSGGVLLFPNSWTEIKQVTSTPFIVDAQQMALVKENVFNYFGVNENILQNKAFGDAWGAFYEGAVEWFAIQFSEVVTKMVFSEDERAAGAGVMATANRLQYMSNTEKLQVSAQMADRGIMNRDEIREIWNLPPLPDGAGQAYTIRGEYYLLGDAKKKKEKDVSKVDMQPPESQKEPKEKGETHANEG